MILRKVETAITEYDIDKLGKATERSGPITNISFQTYEKCASINGASFWRSLDETESILLNLIIKDDPTIAYSFME